ncbi:hypothetical protein RDABS01_015388 [Bienertia sinuspersici]
MKVVENPAKQFEEAIWCRKQYLDSARVHYLSALAGLSGGKKEQTEISHSSSGSSLLLQDYGFIEAERSSAPGEQEQRQGHNGVVKACEKDLKSVKLQVNRTLARNRNTKSKIDEMFCKLGNFEKEIEYNYARSESDDANGPLPKTLAECSSLHRMVESLKAELEILKKEHAELNEIDAGAEFAVPKSKRENGRCLVERDKSRQISEEVIQDNDMKIKDKGRKRELEVEKASSEVEKRPRVVLDVDEAREEALSTLNQSKCSPEGNYPAYVSTSESSARIMMSEDELEPVSQQMGKSARLVRETLAEATGVEGEKCVGTSEFSIRDFVFSTRNKDISLNWPFSQKNLQLCMRHGVKDVLPPFQPMDSVRESSIKRCLAEKSLISEESTVDKKASILKNNHVSGLDHSWDQELAEGYRDSDSLPIGGERDPAYKAVATANSQSEVESVSTSNLPLSEVSDDREGAASAADNKTKGSTSRFSNKKYRVSMKMRINSKRNTPEDITSACTVPSEAISSKICPVCENFSSSSNTTLNAHIDQCLTSQPAPIWMKSSKLMKPRVKQRKVRLMTDICATALCCTLEDLDRRNGTHWATNEDFPLEDADVPTKQKNIGKSSRHINNVDDGSVYIDSSGTKIRILSKLNDTPSLSKVSEDARPKKQSRKTKRNKFFSPNRKKRLTKHLMHQKVTRQRKRFSSLKGKGHSTEACGAEEAVQAVGDKHIERHQPASYVKELKAQERSHHGVAETGRWISPPLKSNLLQKKVSEANTKFSRNEILAKDDSLTGTDQVGSAQVEPRGIPSKIHLNFPKSNDNHDSYGCVRSSMKGIPDDREFIVPVSSSSLAVGVNETRLRTALDPELEKVPDVSCQSNSLKQGPLRSEANGNSKEPGLSGEHEMFYGNVAGAERSEMKTGNYIINFGHASIFPEVDPIPIPGPPGSDLPSFSDMGSEDLHSNSLSSSLAQLSRDGDDIVNGDLSGSPLSATSTLSNLGRSRKEDFTVDRPESFSASLLIPDSVYPGWLGASSGPLPAISTVSPQYTAAADAERVACVNSSAKGMINLGGGPTTLNHDNQQGCCSQEEVTQSIMSAQESQLLGWRPTSSKSFSRGKHVYSILGGQLTGFNDRLAVYSSTSYHNLETAHQSITSLETTIEAADPSLRTGDCSSASPAPILRLMGKDLMISNGVDTDISRSQAAINVSMNKLIKRSWEPQSYQNPTYMRPLLHGQDPHLLPLRQFDVDSSNVMHSFGSHNQALGTMYINERMHASLSVLGTAHLQ